MGENCVAQHGVRQAAQHRRLNRCHHLACFHAEHSESQYAVALDVDKHFDEAADFAYSDGSEHCGHRYFRQAIGDAAFLSFRFAQTDSRKLRVREHAERYEPIARDAATAVQVVSDHAEIIERDVSELRTARAISHRPHPRGGGFQSLVDLATRIQLDSGRFKSDPLRVRSPSNRDQQVASFYRLFSTFGFGVDLYALT